MQPGCPMHKLATHLSSAVAPSATPSSLAAGCPYPESIATEQPASALSKYNPLNYIPSNLSSLPSSSQTSPLPTSRTTSSIPKASTTSEKWEYPSPQQMYNALLRKTPSEPPDITAIESMVSIHNFLNEGAWAEIVEWERRFSPGLGHGLRACARGEDGSLAGVNLGMGIGDAGEELIGQPRLARFMGRPGDMSPKAAIWMGLGRIMPGWFADEPPFDRHDWFIHRPVRAAAASAGLDTSAVKEVRYVIDYYSAPPDENGEPVFHLDVRPAIDTPTQAVERLLRWGGDIWWRATGGEVVRSAKVVRDA